MRPQSPLRALGAIAAMTSLLIALAAFSPAAQKAPKKSRAADQGTGAEHLIQGGTFEASGVVHVAGTDGFLFVDDGRDDAVFWLRVDKDGRQLEPAVAVPLGVRVGDLEGITTDGTWYYAVGSQSKPEFVNGAGLVRFRFDPAARRIDGVESVNGLRSWVLSRLPSVATAAGTKADGFNIEGLAWDAKQNRLLMGLRSPVIDGQAVIIPLDLGKARDHLAVDRITLSEPDTIRLPLDNSGIRSMEFDAARGAFRVLAASRGAAPFRLWDWTGASDRAAVVKTDASFAAKLKPEGVTAVKGAQDFTLIVFDTSRYQAMP
jgi:hypothetical protein